LGIAVDEDGNMWEGMFKDGELGAPNIYTSKRGTIATLLYPDGRLYEIYQ